ncbi:hypothetical protein GW943_02390 [Candidatus Parcubacteria bacterium]|uniref:Uncharacterized protein n=1 Tax=Candidatus Kaiserbacteria bacterium CG10_big_fil_rev_8_21_14_0_10_47_16 TaxID=1974608 RepID=A0A2H0UDP6_9BACT|nr:hypothetical protein [Candidatus Parcubacteria bacterium]PIR84511.1 MAG: hypothetical protein COU16_02960 [Candidatus Kaiserbacteria bacterium CG10_big_fil_rev_8_21_14_0_10_47_16]
MKIATLIANKRVLLALGMMVFVAALVIGATGAFFNDTETSTGNIFTAGSIDLKVDHLIQTYNDVDCETCSVDVFSSTATQVVGSNAAAVYQGPFPIPATDVAAPHPAWQNEAALAPAIWIWATAPNAADSVGDVEYTFENKFQWNGTAVNVDLDLAIAADNGYKVILNGVTIVDKLATEFNYGSAVQLTGGEETTFMGAMVNGENTLQIVVRNKALAGDPVTQNPAGLLFKLDIDRDAEECAEDSSFQQVCKLWQEKDLGEGDTFFNFNDVKPGDLGTDVISLHVYDNDAYACLIAHDGVDADNSVTEPEADLGDDNTAGELQDYIDVFTWNDNGNGIYENGETALGQTTLGNLGSIASLDTLTDYLSATTTAYVGVAWCAGTLTATAGSDFDCDGETMGNITQSDSYTASLTAYAVQKRNNEQFSCDVIAGEYLGEQD